MWKIFKARFSWLYAVVAIGVLTIVATVASFYYFVGSRASISPYPADWASFANYFGGILGPLLSFLSILLILYTISQQDRQINFLREEAKKSGLLTDMSKAEKEIDDLLKKKIPCKSMVDGYVVFDDFILGIVAKDEIQPDVFKSMFERLLQLTGIYCCSIPRDTGASDNFSVINMHRAKALMLIQFMEKNPENIAWGTAFMLIMFKGMIERSSPNTGLENLAKMGKRTLGH